VEATLVVTVVAVERTSAPTVEVDEATFEVIEVAVSTTFAVTVEAVDLTVAHPESRMENIIIDDTNQTLEFIRQPSCF
jgi:hypothetical protein